MTVYYNDSEPFVCDWMENLIREKLLPAGVVDRRPIQEVEPQDVQDFTQCHFFAGIGGWAYALQLAGWGDRPVWTGSCPCQPLSGAGLRQGHADSRHMWPAFYRLISQCQPPVVFGEQVAGADGYEWFAAVRTDLEGAAYEVGAGDLCPSTFGIQQSRERLFFVAHTSSPKPAGRLTPLRRYWGHEEMAAHREYADWRESCSARVLDDGLPSKLAKSIARGFGNAIVPQVAAAFVSAYLECGA